MCGIVGAFKLDDNPSVEAGAVRSAMERMARRGPDEQGLFEGPGVALGHRRLSILDLKCGQQPMTDAATGVTLVYNGELFNYRELRVQLQAKGQVFKTQSDTEVLLKACVEWGREGLQRLSGMYAFAVFDPRDRSLLLVRDRIGVKPLFYAQRGSCLYFASSMKALLAFPGIEPVLDGSAASHYLTTIRTTLGARTLIRGVSALLPGESLRARRGSAAPEIRRYWDFPVVPAADKDTGGLKEAAAKVRDMMTQAVREQLISDVPLGGFLSGGVDSSILSSLAHQLTGGNYNAYSVGYDLEGYHEWPFVRTAAERYGMWCKEIHLEPEGYPKDWRFLIEEKGLPLSTPNEVPIYHLARALKQDFTVALSGEGADEIFGGYVLPYFSAYDFERARHHAPDPEAPLGAVDRAIRRLYRRPWLVDHVDQHFLLNSWMARESKRALLTPQAWTAMREDEEMLSYYRDLFGRFSSCTTLDQHLQVHARVNLEGLLFRVDSSTMAASVEARVPYTDHRLVEYLFRQPDAFKLNWFNEEARQAASALNASEIDRKGLVESKILLRRAFAQDVDEAILKRKKMSFPVPVREWFAGFLREMAQTTLAESAWRGELFEPAALDRLLQTADQPLSGVALWPVVNLCLWQKSFGVRAG